MGILTGDSKSSDITSLDALGLGDARQAKDTELVEWATEIKVRAERKAGELLREMAETGERAVQKNMKSQAATSTLADLGVNKSQSSQP